MYKELIETYMEDHRAEFLDDLKKIIAIDSQRGQQTENYPFGEGPAKALDETLKLSKKYGLYTENWENYLGIVQLNDDKERKLDIFAHLDIVPPGDGWKKTTPFVLKIEDDKAYGRGTADDKGPALAALYALRFIKDNNISLKDNVRIMLGCDEECGGSDLEYYLTKTKSSEMTFTPDADFPVINLEKGLFYGTFKSGFEESLVLPRIVKVKSGDKGNVVPDKSVAYVQGMSISKVREVADQVEHQTGVKFLVTKSEALVEIIANGKAAHAMSPEKGNNANTAMLELLANLPIADSQGYRQIVALNELFPHGDYNGNGAGIYMKDDDSGEITVSLNLLNYDMHSIESTFDSRTPVCADENEFLPIKNKAHAAGFEFIEQKRPSHYVDSESFFVKTLLKSYEAYSGEKGYCIAIGGGTYVHSIENAVAFGCGDISVDNNMHGSDEFASIDRLLLSAKIFALAIIDLCS